MTDTYIGSQNLTEGENYQEMGEDIMRMMHLLQLYKMIIIVKILIVLMKMSQLQ